MLEEVSLDLESTLEIDKQYSDGEYAVLSQFQTDLGYFENISYSVSGIKMYGTVRFPNEESKRESTNELLLWTHGGRYGVEPLTVLQDSFRMIPRELFDNQVILIPSYRGENLNTLHTVNNEIVGITYSSEGEVDPFVSEIPDSIGLIQAFKENYTGYTDNEYSVFGVSRGANIALRLAAEVSNVRSVIAHSPIADFKSTHYLDEVFWLLDHPEIKYNSISKDVLVNYINSEEKNISEFNNKLEKISAINYIDKLLEEKVLIHVYHGENDDIYSIKDSKAIAEKSDLITFIEVNNAGHDIVGQFSLSIPNKRALEYRREI